MNKEELGIITGYGEFYNCKINPSWEAAKTFKDKVIKENGKTVRLDVEYFDVDYNVVGDGVKEKIYNKNPSFILHIGLNSNLKNTLNFETSAYYTKEFDKCKLNNGNCCEILETDLKWINKLKCNTNKVLSCNGWYCNLSNDPGRYLCNYIYYLSLHYKKENNKDFKVFFLHIPDVINSPQKTQQCINEAISTIIHEIVKLI